MDKTKNLISEINTMLDSNKKLTLEGICFSEDIDDDYKEFDDSDNFENDSDEFRTDDDMNDAMNSDEENPNKTEFNSSIQAEIDKIREICIQTLSKLSDKSTSIEYEMMKKIWNLCDKPLDSKKERNV